MAREFFAPVVSLGWQETNVEFDKKPRFLGLVSTDFFPRPGFYSDSAEFCRKKKQLGDERIFSARQRFSKPNSQTDTQCACSQLGLSSQHTIGNRHFLGNFVQKIFQSNLNFRYYKGK